MNAGISTDTLAAAYELLRASTPFRTLKLPPAFEVTFKLTRDRTKAGECDFDEAGIISVSAHYHGHLHSLLMTVAHEMVHLYQFIKLGKADHGEQFRKLADRVCRAHGFDPKLF